MSPSTEAGLTEKAAVIQKLVVLLPRVVILLKRIHHIHLTSRETGDSRNQMDEKDSQITHHTIPTSAKSTKCPQIRNSPATGFSNGSVARSNPS